MIEFIQNNPLLVGIVAIALLLFQGQIDGGVIGWLMRLIGKRTGGDGRAQDAKQVCDIMCQIEKLGEKNPDAQPIVQSAVELLSQKLLPAVFKRGGR